MKKKSGSSDCADILRALGDPTRLAVLQALLQGPLHVNDLMKRVTVGQSLLSHHLKVLREAGLVLAKRDGKAVLYRVAPAMADHTPGQSLDFKCCQVTFSPVTIGKRK
jgi:DNA-binding transcriptional ArsR family regulator